MGGRLMFQVSVGTRKVRHCVLGLVFLVVGAVNLPASSTAQQLSVTTAEHAPERARYAASSEDSTPRLRFTPIKLAGGSKLTLIAPVKWSDVADEILSVLSSSHTRYGQLFGEIPSFSTAVRLMEDAAFYELTGAPTWTNAMFFRGQIIIPLAPHEAVDMENIQRSVRHEYTHAILSALSGGRAPGWLDEGIAQWAEGTPNPALRPALKNWLSTNEPLPLSLLQGGFTKLNPAMVPAAYAQSLVAADTVMQGFGFKKISHYLKNLRNGIDKRQAFHIAFGVTDQQFEARLGLSLSQWAAGEFNHSK